MQLTGIISLALFPLVLFAVAAAALFSVRVVRGRNKRLLLAAPRGAACDGFGRVGVSVICNGDDTERLASMLAVEYPCYEVVAVVDSVRNPEAAAFIRSTYRMMTVDYLPSAELPPAGVRGLYRSVKRCYRRLVMVDVARFDRLSDFDAALGVASCDYVLPLPDGVRLLPGSVERLVVEICSSAVPRLKCIDSALGAPVVLYARESVVACGGFVAERVDCARGERRTLYEPLAAFGRVAPHAELQLAVAMSAVVLVAAVVVACFGAVWVAVAVSLALLFVTMSLWLVSPFANPESRGPEAFVRTAQNFCEKIIVRNITMPKKYVTFITEKKQ